MNPSSYIHNSELERFPRIVAVLFLVIGTAIVTAALIVHFSAANFRFGPVVVEISLLPFVIFAAWFVVAPHPSAWRQDRSSFLNAGGPLAWENHFANRADERPLVLIADRDIFMRSVLDFHLTCAGFRVEHASSKDEAISKMSKRPQVVLLDLSLSGANRFYGLRDIRESWSQTKLIALTRKCDPRDQVIRKLGASGSLKKPFDPRDALEMVSSAVEAAV